MGEQPSERLKRLVTLARALSPAACEYQADADAACAQEVAVYQGDINANARYFPDHADPLLSFVVFCHAPLTLAALAARGDVDVYRFGTAGFSAVASAAASGPWQFFALLDAFPRLDVNAPCKRDGTTLMALQLAALIAPHILWAFRLRREWAIACVALASGAAETPPLPRSGMLLPSVLADALRVCIAPGPDHGSHQLLSEYAGLVAAFL